MTITMASCITMKTRYVSVMHQINALCKLKKKHLNSIKPENILYIH